MVGEEVVETSFYKNTNSMVCKVFVLQNRYTYKPPSIVHGLDNVPSSVLFLDH